MNPDKLLDAFGMIDDRFLVSEKKVHAVPLRKRLLVLIAAILVFMLFVGIPRVDLLNLQPSNTRATARRKYGYPANRGWHEFFSVRFARN